MGFSVLKRQEGTTKTKIHDSLEYPRARQNDVDLGSGACMNMEGSQHIKLERRIRSSTSMK